MAQGSDWSDEISTQFLVSVLELRAIEISMIQRHRRP